MSNRSSSATAIAYAPRFVDSISPCSSRPERMVAVSVPTVLLVGRNAAWGPAIVKCLTKFGSELSFAAPRVAASKYLKDCGFDLILLDTTVSREERRQIESELIGSTASVYYTFPVENGCWWLPTVRRGEQCHGAPAFRRHEFPFELARILGNQPES
jgi:hypothetical protein